MDLKNEIKKISDEIAAQYEQIKKIQLLADDLHDECMCYDINKEYKALHNALLSWRVSVIRFSMLQDYITQMHDELREETCRLDKLCEELRKVEV